MLLKKVEENIRKNALLKEGETVVVAVSGGPDSVVLLDCLVTLKDRYSLKLLVAHVNHSLRAAESDRDEEFVTRLSKGYGITSFSKKVDVRGYARKNKLSLEDAARSLRYQFLGNVAAVENADKIALGHNANDQVETILLFLLRGTGRHGLAGMPVRRGKLIRPLLGCWRREIESYSKEKNLHYRVDSSNLKTDYLRNKIRLRLLPELARNYNPQIYQHLYTLSEIIAEEDRFLDQCTDQAVLECAQSRGDSVVLKNGCFQKYSPWLKRRIVHKLSGAYSFAQSERILLLAGKKGPAKELNLGSGRYVRKEYANIIFSRKKRVPSSAEKFTLAVPGITTIPELNVVVKVRRYPKKAFVLNAAENRAQIDEEKVAGSIALRLRWRGDAFQPFGMGGKKKKLKDYFMDKKVPRSRRDRVPLVVDEKKILFVAGLGRIDERVKITKKTKTILEIEVAELEKHI